ncbi:MAG: 4-alpha-glucanotransferase [Chlamydiia bacterium]
MIGIATPLTFLRSQNSQGVGDLEDLYLLIDWCSSNKIELIQLLPINDTGLESSPYAGISSVALNPIYLRLPTTTPFLKYLNDLDRTPYSIVIEEKMRLLKEMSLPDIDPQFLKDFPTLKEFAVYKTLKEQNNYSSHSWFFPQAKSVEEILKGADSNFLQTVDFHLKVQQHLFHSWKKVKAYADQKGVFLMGDLPIVVFKESHEVYFHPHLFDLNFEAGAPPDAFAPEGQNWGQPVYRWEEHEKEGYKFFEIRLKTLEQFFSYYRIDHTIGFFHFWQVPVGEKGVHGKFDCTDPHKYLPKAKERLTALLKATSMKPIAEDLGTKPEGMDMLLKELHIPGMKVLRWEEDTDNFPALSMSAISLHDISLLGSWFKQENGRQVNDEERITLLKASLTTPSFYKINLLQEYLDLEPRYRFDFDEQERINIPGTVLPTNWTVRMRPYLEEILQNKELSASLSTLLNHL